MKGRTTLILLACVVFLGLFIWGQEFYRVRVTREYIEEILFFNIDAEDLKALRFEYSNTVVQCRNENDEWTVVGETEGRADIGRVNWLVSSLNSIGKGTRITKDELAENGLDESEYGFDQPAARIIAVDNSGRREWVVGNKHPLADMAYAKRADEDDIYTIPSNLMDILPKDAATLRNRILFSGEISGVRRVELRGDGGLMQLSLDPDTGWRIQQPISAHADQVTMAALLDNLFQLRVEKFLADDVSDFSVYGLQSDARHVSLGMADGTARTIILGDEVAEDPGFIYARRADESSVYGLNKDVLDVLTFERDDFRDRRVVPMNMEDVSLVSIARGADTPLEMVRGEENEWQVSSPVRWKVCPVKIDRLLKSWNSAFIMDFEAQMSGDEEPATMPAPLWTLSFGDATQTNTIYVLPESDPGGALRIRRNQVADSYLINFRAIPPTLADPLHYKDPVVLDIDASAIQRISLDTEQGSELIERDSQGIFNAAATNVDVRVDRQHVERMTGLLGALTAEKYVTYNQGDLGEYGLDTPAAVLHVGLAGSDQIGYVLLFGREADEGGRYAMVKGRDVIFVLNAEDASLLTGALVAPVSGESEPGG